TVAVVVDRDGVGRRARGALEAHVTGARAFAAAVPGAELGVTIVAVGLALRMAFRAAFQRCAARGASRVERPRLCAARERRDVLRRGLEALALEEGHADHAHVVGPAGARGVRIGELSEI